MFKQAALEWFAKSKACEGAISAHHTVTGDDQTDGIRGVGSAYRTRRARIAHLVCDLAIGAGFTERNFPQCRPNAFLKCCAIWSELEGEMGAFAAEKLAHLAARCRGALRVSDEFIRLETFAKFGLAAKTRGDHCSVCVQSDREVAERGRKAIEIMFHIGID
jgi:hypothetical protein